MKNKQKKLTLEQMQHNTKYNRITFWVFGVLLCILGISNIVIFVFGIAFILFGFMINKRYKKITEKIENRNKKPEIKHKSPDKIKVIDIDGKELEAFDFEQVANEDIVLIAPESEFYHTRVGCFRNWEKEKSSSFTGWQAVKKEDVINKGMCYCKFCKARDDMIAEYEEDDDLEDEITEL